MTDLETARARRTARKSKEKAAQALRLLAASFGRAADEIAAGTLTRSAEDLMAEAIEAVKAVGRHQGDESRAAEPLSEA